MLGNIYSGTIGKAVVASHKGRTHYIKKYTKPSDPKTEIQLAKRDRFRNAVKSWQRLNEMEKAEYNMRAKKYGRAGYNLYLSQYIASTAS
ncbi:MAG: hypothetical protein QMC83_09630 [Thermodesulfovibrionales bacterium]|nr:hypothetical protein [Thermodesulfovibrionales bacterium]